MVTLIFLSLLTGANNLNDHILLFQSGEEKGFTWFYRQFYPALCFFAFKITADKEISEDIASGAFMKIWQKHEKFSDALSVKKYLYRIVRNDALKHLAKEKRSAALQKEVIYLYGSNLEHDCFHKLVSIETNRLLVAAIDTLPSECARVFRLMYLEGRSIKETAAVLQLSPSTVKTQKARGIEVLRKTLRLLVLPFV